jgi:hypothetical protein
MYIEALGLVAFAFFVVWALGLEAYGNSSIHNRRVTALAMLSLLGVGSYLLGAAAWDAALAWYVSHNPSRLPPNPFLTLEMGLQIYQSAAIWIAIPMVFMVRWIIRKGYRRK